MRGELHVVAADAQAQARLRLSVCLSEPTLAPFIVPVSYVMWTMPVQRFENVQLSLWFCEYHSNIPIFFQTVIPDFCLGQVPYHK